MEAGRGIDDDRKPAGESGRRGQFDGVAALAGEADQMEFDPAGGVGPDAVGFGAGVEIEGAEGEADERLRAAEQDTSLGEVAGFEAALGVGELGFDGEGAGGGIEGAIGRAELAVEGLARQGSDLGFDGEAGVEAGGLGLGQREDEAERVDALEAERLGLGGDKLTDGSRPARDDPGKGSAKDGVGGTLGGLGLLGLRGGELGAGDGDAVGRLTGRAGGEGDLLAGAAEAGLGREEVALGAVVAVLGDVASGAQPARAASSMAARRTSSAAWSRRAWALRTSALRSTAAWPSVPRRASACRSRASISRTRARASAKRSWASRSSRRRRGAPAGTESPVRT